MVKDCIAAVSMLEGMKVEVVHSELDFFLECAFGSGRFCV